jgi:hypothetical protein
MLVFSAKIFEVGPGAAAVCQATPVHGAVAYELFRHAGIFNCRELLVHM